MAKKKAKRATTSVKKASSNIGSMAAALAKTSSSSKKGASSLRMSVAQLSMSLLAFFVVTFIVLGAAAMFFPQSVVLGTHMIGWFMALVTASAVISLVAVGCMPVIEVAAAAMNTTLKDRDWMVLYFVINTVSVWIVGRFSEQVGMGIDSWIVAVVLGFLLNIAQGLVIKPITSAIE